MQRSSTLAVLVGFLLPSTILAQEVMIPAKVVTGFNLYLDQPFVDYGEPLGEVSFSGLGELNPGGTEALPLTGATSGDALLATVLDPNFLGLVGLGPDDVDPALLNVPLRDVATNVGLDGATRLSLPGSDAVNLVTPAQVGAATPVDLATWNRARGAVSIQCHADGSSSFWLRARNLLPNRLYTVWGNYFRPDLLPPVRAHAMGGVPNAFVSDAEGQGSFSRTLSECPLEPDSQGRQLLSLDLIFHSDHHLVGAIPSIPDAGGGLGQGAVAHPHLGFNVAGTELLTPEGWGDSGTCVPGNTVHCFGDGRFQVAIEWTDFNGVSGPGIATDFGSDDAGSFYFFDPRNKEMLVKVIDGCGFNQHFWVFAAAATDVAYTLTVTDTQTQQTRTYENSLGQASPATTDTSAFATCP